MKEVEWKMSKDGFQKQLINICQNVKNKSKI